MHNAFMPGRWEDLREPHHRLKWAREDAGYRTASDAARAMGVPIPTYVSHENSGRGLSRNAVRYALFYRVSLDWLMTGRGAPKGQSRAHQLIDELPPELMTEVVNYLSFLKEQTERGRR